MVRRGEAPEEEETRENKEVKVMMFSSRSYHVLQFGPSIHLLRNRSAQTETETETLTESWRTTSRVGHHVSWPRRRLDEDPVIVRRKTEGEG